MGAAVLERGESQLGVALELSLAERGVTNVAVAVELHAVASGEHHADETRLLESPLADHEEGRPRPAAVELFAAHAAST